MSAVCFIMDAVTRSTKAKKAREDQLQREKELKEIVILGTVIQNWKQAKVQEAINYVRGSKMSLQGHDAYIALVNNVPPGDQLRTVFSLWEEISRPITASLIPRLSPDVRLDCINCWKCLMAVARIRRSVEPDFAAGFERLAHLCGYTADGRREVLF